MIIGQSFRSSNRDASWLLVALAAASLVLGSFGCSPAERSTTPNQLENTSMTPSAPVEETSASETQAPVDAVTPENETSEDIQAALLDVPVMPPTSEDFAALEEGIVAQYTFDEIREDGRISDVSGNGCDLALEAGEDGAGAELVESIRGKALVLSGDDSAICSQPTVAQELGNQDFSIAVWFSADQDEFKQFGMLAGWVQREPSFQIVELRLQRSGGVNGLLFNMQRHAPAREASTVFADTPIDDGKPHLAVVTRSMNEYARVFVDGLPVAYAEDAGWDMTGGENAVFGISAMYPFAGTIDEVCVWNKALTPSQVKALHETAETE